jgi:hypothetical protein
MTDLIRQVYYYPKEVLAKILQTAVWRLFRSGLHRKRHLIIIGIPLDGSQWIVQVQPTPTRNLITLVLTIATCLRCRLDLNNPLTAVKWDSRTS